jgi:glyoxylase-like metal-dependent hydrolase (beta-lactamase superfamily II)
MSLRLPDSIQVIERGWLSSNNVLLCDGAEATLVDSGYQTHAAQTVALVRTALVGRQLTHLVNTHSHSDHIGGNAAVQRAFGCEIVVPAGMADAVERWDEDALLLSIADQVGEAFSVDATIEPGGRVTMGGCDWDVLEAPGHDMDAVVFHDPDRRILISGDALWRDGFGILFAEVLGSGDGIGATRRTLEAISRLSVDIVIPGHGAPFVEFDDALERAFGRLAAFEADGSRIARNAIRACISFRLLDLRGMDIDELVTHLGEVPLYREANTRFLGLTASELADWLVEDLVRAGVARREGDRLFAA